MPETRFYCSVESRERGEAVFGTVARIRSWLLLEYPPVWRRNGIQDSRLLSQSLKDHIRRLPIDRALLVRQQHVRPGPIRCFFVRSDGEVPTAVVHEIEDYEKLPDVPENGAAVNNLMFAICTHGRHDKCCAKFGNPVWCAFREQAGSRAWQCSHVGGDRFAGNVVVFPYGIFYGHVRPDDVPEIIRRSDAGEVWMPGFRGRSCYARRAQVGEYFVRAESGRLGIDEFELVQAEDVSEDVTRVSFRSRKDETRHTVEYVTRRDGFQELLTCEATVKHIIPQYDLRSYTSVLA